MLDKPTVNGDTLSYPIWWRTGGGGLINRDYLDHDHPQQTYNYLKSHGIVPEHYGVEHPRVKEMMRLYGHMSRVELIHELMSLRDTIHAYERAGF